MRWTWIAAVLCLLLGATGAAAQINTSPIRIDNSDGCGSPRAGVEAGRDMIRQDRSYRESDRWFQDRLQKLQTCIAEIPKRRAQYQAERQRWEGNKSGQQNFASSALAWMLALLPVAIFLSYAQSAGVAGNGAQVRLRDWKGQPLFLWVPVAVAAAINYVAVQSGASVTYDASNPGTDFVRIIGGIAAIGLCAFALFVSWQFIRESLWSTVKGVFILLHYMIARHPTQQHLPSEVTEAIARGSFGDAIRTHDVEHKGFWVELITPSFVRRHKIERAAQIKDLIEGAKAAATIKDSKEWREGRPAQVSVPEADLVAAGTALEQAESQPGFSETELASRQDRVSVAGRSVLLGESTPRRTTALGPGWRLLH